MYTEIAEVLWECMYDNNLHDYKTLWQIVVIVLSGFYFRHVWQLKF